MKKTYITPEALTVVLGASTSILTGSDLRQEGDKVVGSVYDSNATGSGLTKENVNVWDEEW